MSEENKPEDKKSEDNTSESADSELAAMAEEAISEAKATEAATSANADEAVEAKPAGLDQASLLRRVDALGGEDANEKFERAEEEKLRARTQNTKKKSSKLAADANRRLEKIGEKKKNARVAEVGARLPARDRFTTGGDSLVEWAKKHTREIAVAVFGALVLGGLFMGYSSYKASQAAKSGELLSKGVIDARAPIVADPEKEKRPGAPKEHSFKTSEERHNAALAEFREVKSKFPGTGPGFLAELAEGSLLLDDRDFAGAITAYDHVAASPLGQVDVEVRGRALEGLGFAYELKAQKEPAALDDAMKKFKELELTEALGFKELGIYHQARVAEAKGDKEKATQLLKDLRDRFAKIDTRDTFRRFLIQVSEDRLRALDPAAVPARNSGGGGMPGMPGMPPGMGGGKGGAGGMDPAKLRELMEKLKAQGGAGGGHP